MPMLICLHYFYFFILFLFYNDSSYLVTIRVDGIFLLLWQENETFSFILDSHYPITIFVAYFAILVTLIFSLKLLFFLFRNIIFSKSWKVTTPSKILKPSGNGISLGPRWSCYVAKYVAFLTCGGNGHRKLGKLCQSFWPTTAMNLLTFKTGTQ